MRIDLRGMSRTCYRYKSCEFPPAPHTADEVKAAFEVEQNMNRFGKCWVGNQKDGEEEQANDAIEGTADEVEIEIPTDFYRGTYSSTAFSYTVFASQRIVDLID